MFHCERCGRQVGTQMLDCPERQLGSCSFTVQRNRIDSSRGRVLLALGILFAFSDWFCLAILLFGWVPANKVMAGTFIFLVCSIIILAIGFYLTVGERVTLFNTESGQVWRQQNLGRLEIQQVTASKLEPLPLDAYLILPRDWPASLSALLAEAPPADGLAVPYNRPGIAAMVSAIAQSPAAYLFEATLLGLLGAQRIRLCRAQVQHTYFGLPPKQAVEYFALPGEVDRQEAEGWLEQRILSTVYHWNQYKEARDWPQGAPIKALVRAIYTQNQASPGGWLALQVQGDAEKRGLGTIRGKLRRHFDPNPGTAAQLADEGRSVRAIYDQLGRVFPDFIRDLDLRVRQGIASRQERSG